MFLKPQKTLPAWKLGYKAAQSETTNLFHPPRRVKTDSILDLWRFQRKSVWHVHTQHCHLSETSPSMTISGLSDMSAEVDEHCQCEFGADSFSVKSPGWTSVAPAAGRQSCVLIGPKFVTRSYLCCASVPQPGHDEQHWKHCRHTAQTWSSSLHIVYTSFSSYFATNESVPKNIRNTIKVLAPELMDMI